MRTPHRRPSIVPFIWRTEATMGARVHLTFPRRDVHPPPRSAGSEPTPDGRRSDGDHPTGSCLRGKVDEAFPCRHTHRIRAAAASSRLRCPSHVITGLPNIYADPLRWRDCVVTPDRVVSKFFGEIRGREVGPRGRGSGGILSKSLPTA